MSKIQTCNNCKALTENNCCRLGKKIKSILISKEFHLYNYKPIEKCNKPLTIKKFYKEVNKMSGA